MDSLRWLCTATVQLLWPTLSHPLASIETAFPTYYPFMSKRFSPATDIGNLDGKVILVTGGNGGLGKETILQLSKHGPRKIFLAARNEQKARDAIASIKSELAEEMDIEHIPLDLASLQSVHDAAKKVISRTSKLDILVLNAGVMALPPETTVEGFEIHVGINHIGHHLLTKLLLPLLKKTATEDASDVRIVTVSSEGHRLTPPIEVITRTDGLLQYSPLVRYAASKAANILFASELARRFPDLMSVSIHPGIIMTDLYSPGQLNGDLILRMMQSTADLIAQDVPHGALTQLWAAVGARKGDLVSGGYYTVETLRNWNTWSRDEKAGRKLWEWTEAELTKAGYR